MSDTYSIVYKQKDVQAISRTYPDSLIVGDALFPMIYIYYFGTSQNKNKVGNPEMFTRGMADYFEIMNSMLTSGTERKVNDQAAADLFTANLPKYYRALTDAISSNPSYLFILSNEVSSLMGAYKSRLPQNRKTPYYKDSSGTKFGYFPMIENQKAGNLEAVMETLRILFENGIIEATHKFSVKPINLYTGEFVDEAEDFAAMNSIKRVLGLPTKGMFTINNRPKTDYMFRTFSGIDIITLASLNTTVTKLDGMTSISWSIHRGKSPSRTLGKATAPARAGGTRTIAGTMIFTLADSHPLLSLLPEDYPVFNQGNLGKVPEFWGPNILPDEIPPFDLMVTMTNEYGYACIVSLYGIEVIDEGTVLSVDNLITECVIQYSAVAMDPITSVPLDANGDIDPYGILQGGYSRLWKHREGITTGAAYSDLGDQYESQYDFLKDLDLVKNRPRPADQSYKRLPPAMTDYKTDNIA